jgi:hypothetical protein
VALERDVAKANEQARNPSAIRRDEGHVTAAVSQLEQAHVELHRRSESLRQRTRTLCSSSACSRSDATVADPRQPPTASRHSSATTCRRSGARSCLSRQTRVHVPRRVAGTRTTHRRGPRIRIGQGVAGASRRRANRCSCRTSGKPRPPAARPAFHDGLVHRFPLVYQATGRRREPHESRAWGVQTMTSKGSRSWRSS